MYLMNFTSQDTLKATTFGMYQFLVMFKLQLKKDMGGRADVIIMLLQGRRNRSGLSG